MRRSFQPRLERLFTGRPVDAPVTAPVSAPVAFVSWLLSASKPFIGGTRQNPAQRRPTLHGAASPLRSHLPDRVVDRMLPPSPSPPAQMSSRVAAPRRTSASSRSGPGACRPTR